MPSATRRTRPPYSAKLLAGRSLGRRWLAGAGFLHHADSSSDIKTPHDDESSAASRASPVPPEPAPGARAGSRPARGRLPPGPPGPGRGAQGDHLPAFVRVVVSNTQYSTARRGASPGPRAAGRRSSWAFFMRGSSCSGPSRPGGRQSEWGHRQLHAGRSRAARTAALRGAPAVPADLDRTAPADAARRSRVFAYGMVQQVALGVPWGDRRCRTPRSRSSGRS